MNNPIVITSIEILGKVYQIKCPKNEIESLKQAARFLEQKMITVKEVNQIIGIEKLAVITALNIVHEFISSEHENTKKSQLIQCKITDLQNKIEDALTQNIQMELQPAE